jgi:hypothetical protein
VFATIILHIVEAAVDGKPGKMLEEALEMIRESVVRRPPPDPLTEEAA